MLHDVERVGTLAFSRPGGPSGPAAGHRPDLAHGLVSSVGVVIRAGARDLRLLGLDRRASVAHARRERSEIALDESVPAS